MNWLDQYANKVKLYDNEGLLNFQNVTYNKSNLKMSWVLNKIPPTFINF